MTKANKVINKRAIYDFYHGTKDKKKSYITHYTNESSREFSRVHYYASIFLNDKLLGGGSRADMQFSVEQSDKKIFDFQRILFAPR